MYSENISQNTSKLACAAVIGKTTKFHMVRSRQRFSLQLL